MDFQSAAWQSLGVTDVLGWQISCTVPAHVVQVKKRRGLWYTLRLAALSDRIRIELQRTVLQVQVGIVVAPSMRGSASKNRDGPGWRGRMARTLGKTPSS